MVKEKLLRDINGNMKQYNESCRERTYYLISILYFIQKFELNNINIIINNLLWLKRKQKKNLY